MNEKLVKTSSLVGMIGPIFYFAFLSVLGYLWHGYDPVRTGMSEIGAVDSPFRHVMNYFGFSLLGMVIFVFSLGSRSYFNNGVAFTIAFISLAIGGFFMVVVGFLPCDTGCVDVSLTGHLHSITNTIPAIAIPLAAMISAYPLSRTWGKRIGYTSYYLGLGSLASGPLMLIPSLSDYMGIIQRLGLGLSLIWMMVMSCILWETLKRNKL